MSGKVKLHDPMILGPDGQPAIRSMIAAHNRRNRARIRAQIGNWQQSFRVGEEFVIRRVRFVIREFHDDMMIMGQPECTEADREWFDSFREGQLFPLRGWEFVVFDLMFNAMFLRCRGPTGKRRKGRW